MVLTDVGIQRIGGGEVIHVPGLHLGIFEVTQEVLNRGVLEIEVPIKKIIRIKILNKHGLPAPNQRLSIWGSNEQPNGVTAREAGLGDDPLRARGCPGLQASRFPKNPVHPVHPC